MLTFNKKGAQMGPLVRNFFGFLQFNLKSTTAPVNDTLIKTLLSLRSLKHG